MPRREKKAQGPTIETETWRQRTTTSDLKKVTRWMQPLLCIKTNKYCCAFEPDFAFVWNQVITANWLELRWYPSLTGLLLGWSMKRIKENGKSRENQWKHWLHLSSELIIRHNHWPSLVALTYVSSSFNSIIIFNLKHFIPVKPHEHKLSSNQIKIKCTVEMVI